MVTNAYFYVNLNQIYVTESVVSLVYFHDYFSTHTKNKKNSLNNSLSS